MVFICIGGEENKGKDPEQYVDPLPGEEGDDEYDSSEEEREGEDEDDASNEEGSKEEDDEDDSDGEWREDGQVYMEESDEESDEEDIGNHDISHYYICALHISLFVLWMVYVR